MKKVIIFLSVVAMMMAMSITVSFAAGNTVVFTAKNKTTNSVEIDVSLDTEYADLQTIALYLDFSDAADKGATITGTAGEVATFRYVAAKKMFICNYIKTDGVTKYPNKAVLGTIKVENITSDFDIATMVNTAGAVTKISSTANGEVTSAFGTIGTKIKMVEATADYYAATLTWDAKAQANTGVKFNFSDSTDNKNKYAKVAFGDVTFEADLDVTVAVEVKNAPAGALTFTGAEWYLD